jgi:hypothetical protein
LRSYIKIQGPPILKAIEALEKMAIPEQQVCIMDGLMVGIMGYGDHNLGTVEGVSDYFELVGGDVSQERCGNIISKHSDQLGDYDFFFEWFTDPKPDQLKDLIGKIDEVLAPLGCSYEITSK